MPTFYVTLVNFGTLPTFLNQHAAKSNYCTFWILSHRHHPYDNILTLGTSRRSATLRACYLLQKIFKSCKKINFEFFIKNIQIQISRQKLFKNIFTKEKKSSTVI